MRLTCLLSFLAAVVLGVLLFGNGRDAALAMHGAFLVMVATFVASGVAVISRVVTSQVEVHTNPPASRNQHIDKKAARHSQHHHTRPARSGTGK